MLYGVLLCVALIFIFAMFVFEQAKGTENENDMTITANGNLEVSLDREGWNQKQTPEYTCSCPIITSDGVNFYYSDTLNIADDSLLNEENDFFQINSRDDRSSFYIDVVAHFRSSANSTVYLQSSSFIKGVKLDTDDAGDANVTNAAIAGALRVAFYEIPADKINDAAYQPTANDLKCIWIPNANSELHTDAEGKLTFKNNGTREEAYGYLTSTESGTLGEMNTWSAADYASGKIAVGNGGLATKTATADGMEYTMINGATPLLDFDGSQNAEKTMMIRIWVEGTDREAQSRLNSDMVRYKFDFLAIEKQYPTSEDIAALESITYDAEIGLVYGAQGYSFSNNPVLYSYDGITWTPYGETNHPGISDGLYTKANGDRVLFIKLIETAETKPSEYREILIASGPSNGTPSQ